MELFRALQLFTCDTTFFYSIALYSSASLITVIRSVPLYPLYKLYLRPDFVSIHAPAGGATRKRLPAPHSLPVSIHAPAGGATLLINPAIIALNLLY